MATAPMLRMRDVCERTGLARSTIHHYIREGLLPRPHKTGRNTALYPEAFVRRALLVKTLVERTHLPLAAIRETLERTPDARLDAIDVDGFARVTETIAEGLRAASGEPVGRAELREHLSAAELDGLQAVGLIDRASGRYSPLDARIALAYARIRDAGVAGAGGAHIVEAYRTHLTALAREEAREMVRRLGALADLDLGDFIRRAAGPLGELVAALHQKALIEALTEMLDGEGDR